MGENSVDHSDVHPNVHPDPRLARALGYPYPVPDWGSFLFTAGRAVPMPPDKDLSARTPVLAVGSNRSPEQLRRKFGDSPNVQIPVTPVAVPDHDVAYSAYLTRYGSVPATLIPAAGHVAHLSITWLSAQQLILMHGTESVGRHTLYGRLHAAELAWQSAGQELANVHTYASKLGLLAMGLQPTPLAAIAASNRQILARSQREVLVWVHERHGQGAFDAWLQSIITDEDKRVALNATLARAALSAPLKQFEAVRHD